MRTMAVGRIIILFGLFAQALSAPSGCIESCNFYHSSYQSRQTSGGHQDHADLIQSTNLNEHDYARPGNWTEHNQYDTGSGHGKVHEERGQYVDNSKRVRYYKKNFTSSYSTSNIGDAGTVELDQLTGHRRHDSVHVPSNQHLDSQSAYDQVGATSVTRESGYSRIDNQQTQSSSKRIDSQSERLEDFGEYSGHSQVNQRVSGGSSQASDTNYHTETIPQNWSRVDSYKTDGGHGQVFEEEGQYMTGPKKVRYYKKNYTSSYNTSGVPVDVSSTTLQDLHHELQQNLHKQLDNFRRDFHQTSNVGHVATSALTNSAQSLTQETVGSHSDDLQTAESDMYRQQLTQHRVPSTGPIHTYVDQQPTFTDTRQHTSYTYPSATAGTYGTESQRTYQSHETYVSRAHPQSQPTHMSHLTPVSPDYLQRPVIRDGYQSSLHNVHSTGHHTVDDTQRRISSTHQSNVAQNQLFADNSQRVYHPSPDHGTYPNRRGQTTHYEEHRSSSSRTGENVYPDHSASYGHDRAHYDRDAYNEYLNRHRTTAQQGYDSRTHTSGNTYNSAYRTTSGQLVTGSLDLGHVAQGAADCTEEVQQQYQQESRYHRKYKRDDQHGFVDEQQRQTAEHDDLTQQYQEFGQESQQSEDLTQQSQGFGQQTLGNQHLEDLTQQNEQFTQQTEGSDDFTQQTSGKLEFGQQTISNQHPEDLTQQSEQRTQQTNGKLEFGQHTAGNQHLEDLTQQSEQFTQQTEGSDDFTQQTSGKLEFGQQTMSNQHPEDLTQQSEQRTQQTSGRLEFGQHTAGNQHLEDLTQQSEQFTQQTEGSDDFTQQTSGKLEFGQQHVDNKHLEDLTQQRQQTEGQLEFGQHTSNLHLEDLTQQNAQSEQQTAGSDHFTQQSIGEFKYGQQADDSQQLEHLTQVEQLSQRTERSDDITQQTSGKLEFGQQTVDNQHLEDLTQQTDDFTQQTEDDFAQQTSGKLELGQQTVGDQHLEDYLTQQTEQFGQQTVRSDDFAQQTSGKLELGQQTVGDQHLEDLTQQTEQFGQQTIGSDDFTQQTSGKLELGQQTVRDQHLEDLTQQTEQFGQQTIGSDDFTQQTSGKFELGQHNIGDQHLEDLTQQTEQFGQQTIGSDDFTQQTSGKFELGQHNVGDQHLEDLTQQTEQFGQQTIGSDDFTQHTSGKLELGQQTVGDQHLEDFRQQTEQFGQQIVGNQHLEDLTQQSGQITQQISDKLEFGQHVRPVDKVSKPKNQHLEEFNHQKEDFTQQTEGSDEFKQQTLGHLELGQQTQQPHRSGSQHLEDFTQQVGGFDDFTQQTTGHLEHGQQREQQWKPSSSRYDEQYSERPSQQSGWNKEYEWQLWQMSQKRNFDQDSTQQTDQNQQTIRPASKPKPRQQHQEHDSNPSHTDANIDNISKPIEINPETDHRDDIDHTGRDRGTVYYGSSETYPKLNYHSSRLQDQQSQGSNGFDNEKENIDRLHWVHKSNDATVGLQWHYTYHPSDLTNVESSHNTYYPQYNPMLQQTEQQQKPFEFSQQETQGKHTFDFDQQETQSQHTFETSSSGNQFDQTSGYIPSRVIPLQNSQISQQTTQLDKQPTNQAESRILEAYGGGPYEAFRDDDIYRRVKPNPSATLPPIYDREAWDIREKPRGRETIPWSIENTFSPIIEPTTDKVEDINVIGMRETTTQITATTSEEPPSFWTRVGHKITSTYDKAKEKAKEIFG